MKVARSKVRHESNELPGDDLVIGRKRAFPKRKDADAVGENLGSDN